MRTDRAFKLIFHPWLLASYPALALLAHNIESVQPLSAVRALLVSLAGTALLWLVFRLFLRDVDKAALATSLTVVLFFSYGHAYEFSRFDPTTPVTLGRHRVLVPFFGLAWLLVLIWLVKQRGVGALTKALNWMAAVVLVGPLIGMAVFAVRTAASSSPTYLSEAPAQTIEASSRPDIYYIILDGYSRDDTLERVFHQENAAFLDALEGMGFYVARCSMSNYTQTQLSLASSLNMDYVQNFGESFRDANRKSRAGLSGYIQRSAARQFLVSLGYQTVAFESGYFWTQLKDADIYLAPGASTVDQFSMLGGANEFEVLLLRTSGWRLVADAALKLPEILQPDLDSPRQIHRQRVLFSLEHLADVPRLPSPKFVFAHIASPHRPYVFGPDGDMVPPEVGEIQGYRDQVAYLNQRIIPVLRSIIERSENPPIILLQGDHGGMETIDVDRLRILNAYYMPGAGAQGLYPGITPVNSFRLVFNTYFGTSYKLLEDVAYSSTYGRPFDFTATYDQRPGCTP